MGKSSRSSASACWQKHLTGLQTVANPFDWGVLLRGAPAVPPVMAEFAGTAAAAADPPTQPVTSKPQPHARRSRVRMSRVCGCCKVEQHVYEPCCHPKAVVSSCASRLPTHSGVLTATGGGAGCCGHPGTGGGVSAQRAGWGHLARRATHGVWSRLPRYTNANQLVAVHAST